MKLKKLLPALAVALLLIYLFLPEAPGAGAPQAAPVQSVTAEPRESGGLILLPTASPAETGAAPATGTPAAAETPALDEKGSYTGKEELALYIHTYGHLPPNFITKKDAEKAGWSGGVLDKVLPGMSIGGDYFGNYEGRLPKAKGRRWTECDVNTRGAKSRGEERIVFSNDGLIYYSPDHYESFELLYGQPS